MSGYFFMGWLWLRGKASSPNGCVDGLKVQAGFCVQIVPKACVNGIFPDINRHYVPTTDTPTSVLRNAERVPRATTQEKLIINLEL